jgi:hypothetical protein
MKIIAQEDGAAGAAIVVWNMNAGNRGASKPKAERQGRLRRLASLFYKEVNNVRYIKRTPAS